MCSSGGEAMPLRNDSDLQGNLIKRIFARAEETASSAMDRTTGPAELRYRRRGFTASLPSST